LICRPSPTGPYGEERQDPAANDNDESFTGHIRDEDTGLIYAQARYMDPVIGRFLSGDPVGFSLLC
jgi:RHS repeat-associated protein